MGRSRRSKRPGRHRSMDWGQVAVLLLTAITAIAGCVEHVV
ncbi:hypothetical protein [Streptomyces sp. UH6]|nr:hypothetical protein [Streptomyces sp. UH6]